MENEVEPGGARKMKRTGYLRSSQLAQGLHFIVQKYKGLVYTLHGDLWIYYSLGYGVGNVWGAGDQRWRAGCA